MPSYRTSTATDAWTSLVQINTSALELTNGDVRAYLTGKLFNGMPVIGVDSIRGVR